MRDTAADDLTAAVADGEVFTTGSWYYRLGRAVTAGSGSGALSCRFEALGGSVCQRVLVALEDLPDQIGLLTLRVVVPSCKLSP